VPPSPYRTPAERPPGTEEAHEPHDDRELLPVFAALWVVSILRIWLGLTHGDEAGAEMACATLAVLFLPLLAKDGVLALFRRP
jgi:hypothetical protein